MSKQSDINDVYHVTNTFPKTCLLPASLTLPASNLAATTLGERAEVAEAWEGQAAVSPERVGRVEREDAGVSGQGKRGQQEQPGEALRCDYCCFCINTCCCVLALTGNCCVSGPR